jgi:hypothetical protein
MNNILPSDLTFHEKYDLKGSSYKRKASKNERLKLSPTLKDLDFLEEHPSGIRILDEKNYDYLIKNLIQDSLVRLFMHIELISKFNFDILRYWKVLVLWTIHYFWVFII